MLKPKTVTTDGAAAYSGLGKTTICRLMRDSEVETALVGRRRLIFVDSLEAYLEKKRAAEFVAQPVPWADPDRMLQPRRVGRPRASETRR